MVLPVGTGGDAANASGVGLPAPYHSIHCVGECLIENMQCLLSISARFSISKCNNQSAFINCFYSAFNLSIENREILDMLADRLIRFYRVEHRVRSYETS